MYNQYRFPITWKAFLEIANYYNGNNLISTHLFQFDNGASVINTLSHYINRLGFINPDFENVHFIFFSNNLLLNELAESTISVKGFTKFKEPPAFEIVEILIKRGMTNSANGLGSYLLDSGDFNRKFYGDKQRYLLLQDHLQLFPEKFQYMSIDDVIYYDYCLNAYYKYALEDTPDSQWVNLLNSLIYVLGFGRKTLLIILEKILSSGCKSQCVNEVYNLILDDNVEKIVEVLDFFDTGPQFVWWPFLRQMIPHSEKPKKFVELADGGEINYSTFQIGNAH